MADPLIMRVRKALAAVKTPSGDGNIVGAGMVTGLSAENGAVRFALEFPPDVAPDPQVLEAARTAAASIDGVEKVSAVATAHGPAPAKSAAPRRAGHDNPFGLGAKKRERPDAPLLPGVKKVIAIASGKGGVGKSTVAANLAVALARSGLKVGLLDADIYGPSAPTLFGLKEQADIIAGRIQPAHAHGVVLMSIGLLVKPEQALAWRGPMVMGAIRQLLNDVDWGELDILLIDTPPGTGDAHLSLIQTKRLDGAVIVSTPQEMALADVRRGVNLFEKTETRLIGVIENMAWLEGADGARQYLFGDGGAEKAARDLGAPFLGAIPLYPELRIASDEGAPLAAQDHPGAVQFAELARAIRGRL